MAITLRAALRNAKATSPSGKVQNEDWQDFVDSAVLRVSEVADGGDAHYLDTDVAFTSGNLLSVRNAGVEQLAIRYDGALALGSTLLTPTRLQMAQDGDFVTTNYGVMKFTANGVLNLGMYSDANDFDRLVFGASLATTPALKRSSDSLLVRLGDDSAYADLYAKNLLPESAVLAGDGAAGTPSLSFASDTDTGFYLAAPGDVRMVGGGALRAGFSSNGVTVYGTSFRWSGLAQIIADGAGVLRLRDWGSADFNRLCWGGETNAFPAIQRSGTGLVVRLADDSNYANLTANQFLANSGSAGSPGYAFRTHGASGMWWGGSFTGIAVAGRDIARFGWGGDSQLTADLVAATGDEAAFTIDYEVNKATSGTDMGLYVNKTDTNSPGASYLARFATAGVGGIGIKDGVGGIAFIDNSGNEDGAISYVNAGGLYFSVSGTLKFGVTAGYLKTASDYKLSWFSSANIGGGGTFQTTIYGGNADGSVVMSNGAENDFGLLQFGGTTASFPALKREGDDLRVRNASDANDRYLRVAGIKDTNGVVVVGTQGAAVSDASGGSTVDTEARTAINDLLARCRAHGLIAT